MTVRRWVTLGGLLALVGSGAAAAPFALGWIDAARCEQAVIERRFPDALRLCTRAHQRNPTGEAAASVAVAHIMMRKLDEAWRWANVPEAAGTTRAMRVRGSLLNMRGKADDARQELDRALAQALERNETSEASRAAHALAGLHWAAGRYSAAYDAIEVSEAQAQHAEDGSALALAELAKGDIFREMGDAQRAEAAFRRAVEASAPYPSDAAFAQLKLGLSLADRGALERARGPLEVALSLALVTGNDWVSRAARAQLAEIDARTAAPEKARAHLAALGADAFGRIIRGRVALLEGDHLRALELLSSVDLSTRSLDEQITIETERGEAFLRAGRQAEAAAAWDRATRVVERISGEEPEHQGWVVARRREPFDRLFVLHVESGEHQKAWEVLARYSLSEALAYTPPQTDDIRERLTAAEFARRAWSRLATAEEHEAAPLAEIREVIVVHEAGDRLWVGSRRDGRPHFQSVGPLETMERHLHTALGDPNEIKAATTLGSAFWRAAGVQPSEKPLFVGATGRLRRLAFAALRAEGGRYWMQLRPIARLPALSGATHGTWSESEQALVLGDPEENLPHAREEARWVAGHLKTRALVGEAASRGALLRSRGSRVLHIASHAELALDGATLRLSDGTLTTSEILQHRPSARVVVLASCASSVGREAAGSDSLATAFLRAGTGAVLATLRSVPDEATKRMVQAFYENGGADDPVRALALAQAQLAPSLPASVWSSFLVTVGPAYD